MWKLHSSTKSAEPKGTVQYFYQMEQILSIQRTNCFTHIEEMTIPIHELDSHLERPQFHLQIFKALQGSLHIRRQCVYSCRPSSLSHSHPVKRTHICFKKTSKTLQSTLTFKRSEIHNVEYPFDPLLKTSIQRPFLLVDMSKIKDNA